MPAERRKAALEAASNCVEFPLAVMTIELANHDGRFDGEILAQIIPDQIRPRGQVLNVDVRIGDLAKVLMSGLRVIDRDP